jgi:hypothetical protein
MPESPESARLQEASTFEIMRIGQQVGAGKKLWRKWGPYLSERQMGYGSRGLQPGWECLGLLHA